MLGGPSCLLHGRNLSGAQLARVWLGLAHRCGKINLQLLQTLYATGAEHQFPPLSWSGWEWTTHVKGWSRPRFRRV